ncbi:MAG: hypothetical protein MUE85_08345 [Microscillaceae bacterium]|jgi:hypothetical protein|nr:hypothetical protein [Microscillaceae bacterium]
MQKSPHIVFEVITDTQIIYVPAPQRYEVIAHWEYDAEVENARSGLVDIFLSNDLVIYVEVDMDPLYGGGYPKREKIQKISNFREFGPARVVPDKIIQEINAQLLSL